MAPLVLKIKGNKNLAQLPVFDSEDELSKTWRVCTKVKDSLENGSRLENLSWRLWFIHNVQDSKSQLQELSRTTVRSLEKEGKVSTSSSASSSSVGSTGSTQSTKQQVQKTDTGSSSQQLDFQQFSSSQQAQLQQQQQQQKQQQQMLSQPSIQIPSQLQPPPVYAQQQHAVSQAQPSSTSESVPDVHEAACSVSSLHENMVSMPTATSIATPAYSIQQPAPDYRQNFVLQQFTSDQANDQVVELDDIFGEIEMDGVVNPTPSERAMADAARSFDDIVPIDNSYNVSVLNTPQQQQQQQQLIYYQQEQRQQQATPASQPQQQQPQPQAQHEHQNANAYQAQTYANQMMPNQTSMYLNNFNAFGLFANNLMSNSSKALYVPDIPPPVPNVTLHNRILSMLPPEKLASVERLLSPRAPRSPPRMAPTNLQQLEQLSAQQLQQRQQEAEPKVQTKEAQKQNKDNVLQRHHKAHKRQPRTGRPGGAVVNTMPSEGEQPICSNCETTTTPLWRRSANDELLCNACGL